MLYIFSYYETAPQSNEKTVSPPPNLNTGLIQGCHWSGKSQGNSRSGKSQGILEFVREIWNFVESQGNLRKVREI